MTTITPSLARAGSIRLARPAGEVSPAASRTVLVAAVVAGMAAGFLLTGRHDAAQAIHQAGPEFVRLLRGMALIKVMMAAVASAGVLWRLGSPSAWTFLAGYAAAGAAMAAGPGLIWNMAHVAAGAAFLHGGLLATVLLLWRDPATGRRLAAEVARRRMR